MYRTLFGVSLLILAITINVTTFADDQIDPAKKAPVALAELVKGSADDFIKKFDKNKHGYVTKDDLPPRLVPLLEKFDTNGDGKLDKKEVEAMLVVLRKRFAPEPTKLDNRQQIDALVDRWLGRMDTNKDGKISKEEAQGPLAANFDQLDLNKDGFLDKDELRKAAAQFIAKRPPMPNNRAPQPAPTIVIPDFDALDFNADGRLTREELKGTKYADLFDKINTSKDGKITRKEWEAYFKKEADKKP